MQQPSIYWCIIFNSALKKYRLLFFLFLSQVAVSQEILYLPMNGNASDESVFKNAGKVFGPIKTGPDRFGQPCTSLFFDGFSNYIEVPDLPRYRKIKNAFSLTSWIKIPKSSPSSMSWLSLVCKGNDTLETDLNPAFRVQLMQSQSQATVSISTDFTEPDLNFNLHRFPAGRWFFFALIYDGLSVRCFFDQTCVFSFPYKGSFSTNSAPITVGLDSPGIKEWFHGYLDDFRLFDYAIADKELNALRLEVPSQTIKSLASKPTCFSDTTLFVDSNCSTVFNYSLPKFQLECVEIAGIKVRGPESGTLLRPGKYELAFEPDTRNSMDSSQSCASQITVLDTIPPQFFYLKDSIVYLPEGDSCMRVFYGTPKAKDNCGAVSPVQVLGPRSGDLFFSGENLMVFKATDSSGNSAEQPFRFHVVPFKSSTLNGPINLLDSLSLSYNQPYTLVFFDDGKEDNDTVSIFWNGVEVLSRIALENKAKGVHLVTIIPLTGAANVLASKAWNVGSVPPNTLKMLVFSGDFSNFNELRKIKPLFQRSIRSDLGISGAIKFIPL